MPKLLIVDDDVAVAKLLSDFLSVSGFEIYSANSAKEAEEILKKNKVTRIDLSLIIAIN